MATPVILVIAAGPNLGAAIAKKFADNGYKVALAARSLTTGLHANGYLHIKADLSNTQLVPEIFQQVRKAHGIPNIVVYNGAHRLVTPPDDPFSASLETLTASRIVGLDSAYIAAQEALCCFKELPDSAPTAFIYTGNALNQIPIPGVLPFALPKVAAAMMVEYGANAYGHKGYRFYYADQRKPDGRPIAEFRDGEAHAEMYWVLAHEEKQSKWLVTFTKAKGREEFLGVDFDGNTRASYDKFFGR